MAVRPQINHYGVCKSLVLCRNLWSGPGFPRPEYTTLAAAEAFAYPVITSMYVLREKRLGDAFLTGQRGVYYGDNTLGHRRYYQLLGDPALIINDDE